MQKVNLNHKTQNKLQVLAEMNGESSESLLARGTTDGIAAGICTNPGCDYCDELEPDASSGYCPECDSRSVKSCLVLAGIL